MIYLRIYESKLPLLRTKSNAIREMEVNTVQMNGALIVARVTVCSSVFLDGD